MSGLDVLLSHPASRATAWALLHFLWQGTAVALVLAAALAVLPRRLAQVRFAAAAIALLVMLVLPVVTALAIGAGGRSGLDTMSLAAPLRAAGAPVVGALRELGSTPGVPVLGGAHSSSGSWLGLVIAAWLSGVTLLSLRNLGSWLGVRRLTRHGIFTVPEGWNAALRDLSRRIGVSHPVRLLGSTRVAVPTVVGWIRPAVLVPASAFTGLRPDELEALLAHELAHIRRHDYLLNLIQTFVETLLFYHPAVWWVSRQIRTERENACDDMAAACCGDARRVAVALARMEALRAPSPAFALGADGGSLLSRITRLVGLPAPRAGDDRRLPGTVALLAALALGGSLFALQARPGTSNAALAPRGGSNPGPALATSGDEAFQVSASVSLDVEGESPGTAPALAQRRSSDRKSRRGSGWSSGEGKWEARYQDGHISFEVDMGGSHWGESGNVENYGFSRGDVEALLAQDPLSFRIPQEAGTFMFEGETDSRGRETRAHGRFTFEPDPGYVSKMKALGFDPGDVENRQMELAGHDVTTGFVRELADAGYGDLSLGRLVEFRIHGVDPDYVRGMVEAGYPDLPASRLVEFRIHGIDPDYVRGMTSAGFKDLPASRIVEFKIHGIDPEYVRGMARAGFPDLDPSRVVEFKIHGIDPGYVEDLAASGYRDLPASRIVEFKIHGIEPDYVRGMAEAGCADLPASRLVEFRIHGITPDYVTGLAEAGYADLPSSRLVEFRIHGITPDYAEGLGALGYRNLDAKKLVEMRIHGVTPDSVRRLQEAGFQDLTPDEVIEIHIHGVDRMLRKRGSR